MSSVPKKADKLNLSLTTKIDLDNVRDVIVISFDLNAWWRHQMETFSVLLAICAENSPVTGEFPAQRSVARNFDVFCDLRLNRRS